jgi:FKBP-type peptidyl-prolyl cis-trans isomerase 2
VEVVEKKGGVRHVDSIRVVAEGQRVPDLRPGAGSKGGRELGVEVGAGNLIEGMEEGLLGLEAGDSETLTIPPAEAYGEASEGQSREFDREQFEGMVGQEPVEGMEVRTQGGASGSVSDITGDTVIVDFTHPLAGETLTFEIDVLSVE